MTSHLSHMRWGSNRQHLRELPLTFCGCNRYLWVWLGMDPERKYIINIYFLSEWTVYPEFVNSVTSRITWSVSFIDVRPTGYPVTSRISYSVYFKYIRYLAEYLSWYPVWGWIFVLISGMWLNICSDIRYPAPRPDIRSINIRFISNINDSRRKKCIILWKTTRASKINLNTPLKPEKSSLW